MERCQSLMSFNGKVNSYLMLITRTKLRIKKNLENKKLEVTIISMKIIDK